MPSTAPITVFFDGACPVCRREVALYRRLAAPGAVCWTDIAPPDALRHETFGLDAALTLLHVRDGDGALRIGLDAHLLLWARLPGSRTLARVLVRSAPLRRVADAGYRWFTARRPGLVRRQAARHG
jgi:predicted DCC family thiol-disulfide oxidoreductase YuxK